MTTSRTRAVLLLATALVVGVVIGVAGLTSMIRAGKADFVWRGGGSWGPGVPGGRGPGGGRNSGYGQYLDRELDLNLNAATRDSVSAIWKRSEDSIWEISGRVAPQMDSLYQIIRPDIEARRTQTRAEIRALLAPPQQQRYDSMVKAYDEQRRKMNEQRRRGGFGRGTR